MGKVKRSTAVYMAGDPSAIPRPSSPLSFSFYRPPVLGPATAWPISSSAHRSLSRPSLPCGPGRGATSWIQRIPDGLPWLPSTMSHLIERRGGYKETRLAGLLLLYLCDQIRIHHSVIIFLHHSHSRIQSFTRALARWPLPFKTTPPFSPNVSHSQQQQTPVATHTDRPTDRQTDRATQVETSKQARRSVGVFMSP